MDYLSDLKQHIELIEQQFPFIQQEKAKNCLEGLQVQMNTFIQLSTKQQQLTLASINSFRVKKTFSFFHSHLLSSVHSPYSDHVLFQNCLSMLCIDCISF